MTWFRNQGECELFERRDILVARLSEEVLSSFSGK